jgi:hypothetical protein
MEDVMVAMQHKLDALAERVLTGHQQSGAAETANPYDVELANPQSSIPPQLHSPPLKTKKGAVA